MRFKPFWRNIIWAAIIFILCAVPGDELPKTNAIQIPHFDKIVHYGMFFIMGIFLMAEFRIQTKLKRVTILIISILLIGIYGGAIEFLQQNYFVNRSGDYMDLLADILGSITGIFFFVFLTRLFKKFIAK